jgi:hypothetical protein
MSVAPASVFRSPYRQYRCGTVRIVHACAAHLYLSCRWHPQASLGLRIVMPLQYSSYLQFRCRKGVSSMSVATASVISPSHRQCRCSTVPIFHVGAVQVYLPCLWQPQASLVLRIVNAAAVQFVSSMPCSTGVSSMLVAPASVFVVRIVMPLQYSSYLPCRCSTGVSSMYVAPASVFSSPTPSMSLQYSWYCAYRSSAIRIFHVHSSSSSSFQ